MTITLAVPENDVFAGHTPFRKDAAERAVAEALKHVKKSLGLSDDDLSKLVHIPRPTLNSWLRKDKVPVEKPGSWSPGTEAILHALAIHRSLSVMFESPQRQKEWLDTKHPAFGESPADMMRSSVEGLIQVRRYLDYVRGRGA
jgi:hypothetical protein